MEAHWHTFYCTYLSNFVHIWPSGPCGVDQLPHLFSGMFLQHFYAKMTKNLQPQRSRPAIFPSTLFPFLYSHVLFSTLQQLQSTRFPIESFQQMTHKSALQMHMFLQYVEFISKHRRLKNLIKAILLYGLPYKGYLLLNIYANIYWDTLRFILISFISSVLYL